MSEREPKSQPAFDIAGVSNTLKVPGVELRDVAFGLGQRFTIPEGQQNVAGDLDLYPERFLVRYRGQSLQFDLAHVVSVRAQEKHLRLEAGDDTARAVLFLNPTGSLTLTLTASTRNQRQTTAPAVESNAPEELPEAPATSKASQPQEQTPARPGQAENPGRVVLTGRVGRAPQLRETPNKRLIARMPLAVHEGDKTVWHNVLFFDEKAKSAAEELTKGEIVTVIGYKHTREVPTRSGMKRVEQVFAAAVQRPKQNTPDVATKPK